MERLLDDPAYLQKDLICIILHATTGKTHFSDKSFWTRSKKVAVASKDSYKWVARDGIKRGKEKYSGHNKKMDHGKFLVHTVSTTFGIERKLFKSFD